MKVLSAGANENLLVTVPKLEKLASSLTGMGSPPGTRARPKAKKTRKSKKIVLVKKPTYEQLPPPMMMPSYRQPGMVYVPATWVKKNVSHFSYS